MAGDSGKVVFVAFTMNLGIAAAKFVGFFFTGSTAVLAEAIHSVADSVNQIFLFIGMTRSHKKADALHPFGYGMEQYIWSFIVAILLFSVGGIFSIYEGVHKLFHPEGELTNILWILLMLGAAVAMETYSSIVATAELKKQGAGKFKFFQYVRKSKDQVLVTVLFEDYAALVGLALAAIGLILCLITGNLIFDALASITIGVLLVVIAFFLYRESTSLLVGEAASLEDQAKIRKAFEDHPRVEGLKELLTMHLSADQILVNAHVKFTPGILLEEVEKAIDEIEDKISEAVPSVYKIFIETHQKEQVEDFWQKERKTKMSKPIK